MVKQGQDAVANREVVRPVRPAIGGAGPERLEATLRQRRWGGGRALDGNSFATTAPAYVAEQGFHLLARCCRQCRAQHDRTIQRAAFLVDGTRGAVVIAPDLAEHESEQDCEYDPELQEHRTAHFVVAPQHVDTHEPTGQPGEHASNDAAPEHDGRHFAIAHIRHRAPADCATRSAISYWADNRNEGRHGDRSAPAALILVSPVLVR